MINQISLIAMAAIGIGALFLGTVLAPVFATVPTDCTGDPHNGFRNPDTGNPQLPEDILALHDCARLGRVSGITQPYEQI